jgi:DNA repair protein RecO (recombination protein O)
MPRAIHQPAFLLHARPYRETSALLEMLTFGHGRIGLIYKGAKRSPRRAAQLQSFRKLRVSWSGRGELHTLTDLEITGASRLATPRLKICGLYLNELLMNLLPRNSPTEELYRCYESTLAALSVQPTVEPSLRRFELYLLKVSGYGPQLDVEAAGERAIDPAAYYYYDNERGPVPCALDAECPQPVVSGKTLRALRALQVPDAALARESRVLLSGIIDYQLRGKPLISREIMKYLADG